MAIVGEWATRPGNGNPSDGIAGSALRPRARSLPMEILRLYDMAVIGLTGAGTYLWYVAPPPQDLDRYPRSILLGVIVAAIIFHVCRVYRPDHVFSRTLGARRAFFACSVTFGSFLMIVFILKIANEYSRVWLVCWFVSTSILIAFGRILLSRVTLAWAKQGRFAYRTLIVGVGNDARRLLDHVKARGDVRTQVVGFVDVGTALPSDNHFQGYPVLSNISEAITLLRQNIADEVIVAVPGSGEGSKHEQEKLRELIIALSAAPVPIRLAINLFDFQFADYEFTTRAGLPMLKVFDRPISGWSYIAKSIEDQLLSVTALIFVAPLFLLIAAAIKLDSPGPVFFKQKRFGFNNNLFEVWKFRTMRTECTDARAEVLTTKADPRLTRIGPFLRKSSLDELPQLINVLRGEMSIVGPRPHALAAKAHGQLYQDAVNCYAARHKVKPGITGWAQINGWRGETDTTEKIQERVRHDMYYIGHWSLWLDLFIILKTIGVVVRADNAY